MSVKILLLLVIYVAIWIADKQKLKNLARREFFAYSAMLLLSLYLGISYAFSLKWMFLEEAAEALIGTPARRIIELLTVPS